MTRSLWVFLAALTLLCQSLAAQNCDERHVPDDAWVPTQISAEDARGFMPRRMLIMHAFWDHGPEALLIDEPHQVAAMFDLLARNERVGHLCGFHWAVVFEDDAHRALEHLHNNDCEIYRYNADEIKARLQKYFERVRTRPTHFLIEVELDPSADPDAMARLLERDGRHVFFLINPDVRLPRLQIRQSVKVPMPEEYTDDVEKAVANQARKKLEAVIAKLSANENAHVLEPPAQKMVQFGKTELEYEMGASVVFPLDFKESRLARYPNLAREIDDEPAFQRPASYTVTVVSPEPYSKNLGDAIKAASPLIRKVAPPEAPNIE